jgi:monoamine oxidase
MAADQNSKPSKNINRRQFVGGAAALTAGITLAGASAATGAPRSACRNKDCDYDVVVVGGGFAGVTAARDSSKNGFKTLLLEARNRLGGRTFGADFDGTTIELGGTWIHNTQPFVWAEAERYAMEIKETPGAVPDAMIVMMPDGKRVNLTESQLTEVVAGWEIYCAAARGIVPRPYDLRHNREAALKADAIGAVEHLNSIDLTPLQHTFNEGMISLIASNVASEMSYLEVLRFFLLGGGNFQTFMDATARFQLKDGTEALIYNIVEDSDVETRLSTPVKSIQQKDDRVTVKTSRGEAIRCGALICTVPMNVLPSIEFQPPLPPGAVTAGEKKHPGKGLKIYMKVEGDVGNIATVSARGDLTYVMTYAQGADYTILVGFGPGAERLDAYDEEAVQAALQQHLPGARVSSVMQYDWNNDPYALGTWATYRKGWAARYYDQFQRDSGRILFASGDHGEGWRGTIDGAIGAGVRAARRVELLVT